MIAVGIDPGTRNLGLAVIEVTSDGEQLLEAVTFKTPKGWRIEEVVQHLYTRVEEVLFRWRDALRPPQIVGIENWVYQSKKREPSLSIQKNGDTGVSWEAQAVQRVIGGLYLLGRYFPLQILEPAHWKRQFTGLANCHRADKKEIAHAIEWAVRLRLGVNAGHDFDEHRYDACGVALVVAGMQRITVASGVNVLKIGRGGWK